MSELITETDELRVKINSLSVFITKETFIKNLTYYEKVLLKLQLSSMRSYLLVLEARVENFNRNRHDEYELVRVVQYGHEGLQPMRFNCDNGCSCVSSSGDSVCGHYMGNKVIGDKEYIYCIDVIG